MSETRTIPTPKPADLVTQTIMVDGTEIPGTINVLSITIDKEVNKIASAKLVLVDGNPAEEDFPISNESLFNPGNEIEILAGYHSDESTVFKGIIIKHGLKIRSQGGSMLKIECKDVAIKATVGRKSKYFYESKDSDAIEEVLNASGAQLSVEATSVDHPEIVQYDTTDWDFAITRAEMNGMFCFNENGNIDIKKPDFSTDPVVTLTYGATMLELDAEIDSCLQLNGVKSKSWDYTNQEVLEIEANDQDTTSGGNLSASDLAGVVAPDEYLLHHGGKVSDSELQAWADAKMLRTRMSRVRGRVKFQGIADATPGVIIAIAGAGDKLNGNHYVSAVRHSIANGNWTSDVQFGIHPDFFTQKHQVHSPRAAGLIGAVSGLQIGLVTQLQDDPDGEERILVRLPIINADDEGIWARVASLDAGNERGFYFRPEIGDEVIVGFINDDPRDVIVLGMLHSSGMPSGFEASDDNHEKGYISRSGIKLVFDDEKESCILETPGGKIVTIDDDAGLLRFEDENGNFMEMTSDGITLESAADLNITASGDINIEGTNISNTAQANFTADGSAGIELTSSATAKLQGSLVQIN